jgi:tetratricopeptide (TPR) repeat protein
MRIRWSPIARGAALVALILLAACQSQFLAGGKLHFDQGRYDKALENFEKALAEQPNNGEVHLWYARTLAELERDDEAVAELKRAVELDPLQQEMVTNTYGSYWSKRYNSALAYAKAADQAREQGNESEVTKQRELAEERFRRAIIFAPDSVQNYSNLGKVLFQLGRLDEAMESFQRAKTMSEGKPYIQTFLFSLFKTLGTQALESEDKASLERAVSLLTDASRLPAEPERMIEVHYNLGAAYYALSSKDEAHKAEYLDRAAEYFNMVLTADPEDAVALENLAYVYADQGKLDEATAAAQRRLDLEPWAPESHFLMQHLYKLAKNDRQANAHLLIIQMRNQGERVPVETVRADAVRISPTCDMMKVLRERGAPDERRSYTISQTTYEAWFYWTGGRIYIFQGGAEKFRTNFKGVAPEKLAEILAG